MGWKAYLFSLATDKRRGMLDSAVKFPLFLLSLVYSLIIRLLAFLQGVKPFIPAVPVISVGNITLGGTGKTVFVEYLAELFTRAGRKVAVISRGYKRPGKNSGRGAMFEALGDEAGMLKKKLPSLIVLADPDRVAAISVAQARGAEVIVLDDGFQQWRIRKSLDIVCVDAGGFGNSCLIPAGILREPLSALRRAGVFVLTNTGLVSAEQVARLKESLGRRNPSALIVESNHEPQGLYKLSALKRCDPALLPKAALVCGIGNPASFFASCRKAGIGPGPQLAFPDHHGFDAGDIRRIVALCENEGITAVVTTEKDEIRLPAAQLIKHGLELYVLRITARITENEQKFVDRLRGVFAA